MSLVCEVKRMTRNIKCSVMGHDYVMVKRYSAKVQKIMCKRCHKVFGINHDVRAVVEWDQELDDMIKICYPNH